MEERETMGGYRPDRVGWPVVMFCRSQNAQPARRNLCCRVCRGQGQTRNAAKDGQSLSAALSRELENRDSGTIRCRIGILATVRSRVRPASSSLWVELNREVKASAVVASNFETNGV